MSKVIAIGLLLLTLGLLLFWILYNTKNQNQRALQRNSKLLGISEEQYILLISSRQRKKSARRISKKKRLEVFERDHWSCKVCGSRSNLTVDHILPVSKGGGKELSNLQVLCGTCNELKGDKVIF